MLRYRLTKTSLLILQRGDITRWRGDAIINAANTSLLGGAGVDGAIHQAAGPELRKACTKIPRVGGHIRCPTGEARVTKAFKLPVKHVIHTVGPIHAAEIKSALLLESAYRNSLNEANKLKLAKVAFPAISCGFYGYPLLEAAEISLSAAKNHVGGLVEVHFVFFEPKSMAAFITTANDMFQDPIDDARPWETAVENDSEPGTTRNKE